MHPRMIQETDDQTTTREGNMLRKIRMSIQHHGNPLHLLCRLRGIGINPSTARRLATAYETAIYRNLQALGIA